MCLTGGCSGRSEDPRQVVILLVGEVGGVDEVGSGVVCVEDVKLKMTDFFFKDEVGFFSPLRAPVFSGSFELLGYSELKILINN